MKVFPVKEEISDMNALMSASLILIVTDWLYKENIMSRDE
jgi:hypothetical protein